MDRTAQIEKYRALLPQRIQARIESSDEGMWARLSSDDGRLSNCFTQATNAAELVTMVNDAVLTFFEVPDEFRSDVGYYTPLSENHKRWEEVFNQLVAIEKQTQIQEEVETTLTLKEAELQAC